jgi:hypothetical protein
MPPITRGCSRPALTPSRPAPCAAEAVGISLGIAFILVVTALVKKYCGVSPFR